MIDQSVKDELWIGGLDGLKGKFIKALVNTEREGMENLINYLINSDFFTAPGSANNHNNYPGGLVEHSLLVMMNAIQLGHLYFPGNNPFSTLILCSLLHDVCKVNFYKVATRMSKESGTWQPVQYFKIQDSLPLGHGEKSVIILQQFIKLTTEEIMMIRWHMMGFDESAREYGGAMALRAAANQYPIITLLHMADLAACYLEKKGEEK